MKDKTIFEKIIDREVSANIIYEDKKTIVFLDAFPFEKGHILVVPKKPYEAIWDMPENEYLELQKIILIFAKKIRTEMNSGLNILQNNLKIANQEVPHVHFHLIPRTKDKDLYKNNEKNNIIEQYKDQEEKEKFIELLKILKIC